MFDTLIAAASAIAITIREQFPFEIEKLPLIAQREIPAQWLDNEDPPVWIQDSTEDLETPHFGLFRNDTWECVGNTFKKNYVPHTTEDVITVTEAGSTAFDGDVSIVCHFKNAHYVHIRPTYERRTEIYGTEDNIFPVMGVRGGFDGRGYQAWLGFGRDMCSNMAELKSVASCRVSIHHNQNLRENMDELVETFAGLKMQWAELVEAVQIMEENRFDIDWFIGQLYETPNEDAPKRTVTNYENRVRAIKERLADEYVRTGRPASAIQIENGLISGVCSGWLLYNAIQGYVQHDGRGAGNRTEFQGMIRASESPKVAQAERIALGK